MAGGLRTGMTEEISYAGIGRLSGCIVLSVSTFAFAWFRCYQHYGFLWGFGFGWVPALIAAGAMGMAGSLLGWTVGWLLDPERRLRGLSAALLAVAACFTAAAGIDVATGTTWLPLVSPVVGYPAPGIWRP